VGVVVLASASIVTGVAMQSGRSGSVGALPADPGVSTSDSDTATAETAASSGGAAASAPAQSNRAIAPAVPGGAPTDLGSAGTDVIRTVRMSLQVQDPVAAAADVRGAATAAGGFVAEERSGSSASDFTLRVPTERVDAVTDRLAGLGTVTSRAGAAQDVGGQVADLDGRLAAQQASVARVRALLDRATTISDIVSVESELSARQAALESLQRRVALLRNQVSLATVDVSLTPVPPVAGPPPAGGFLGGLAVGWAGLRAVGTAVQAAAGFVLPLLPVVAVLVGLGWVVRRVLKRRATPPPAKT